MEGNKRDSNSFNIKLNTHDNKIVEKIHNFISRNDIESIFDIHTHSWKRNHLIKKYEPPEEKIQPSMPATTTFFEYECEKHFEDAHVIFPETIKYKFASFGIPFNFYDVKENNIYILKKSQELGLIPFAVVKRDDTVDILNEYAKLFAGFKPYFALTSFDVENMKLKDYLTLSQMEVADSKELPIILHVHKNNFENLREIKRNCDNFQNLKIILAHMGLSFSYSEFRLVMKLVKENNNIFLDTSVCADPIIFRSCIKELGPGRLIYGSDNPFAFIFGKQQSLGLFFKWRLIPKKYRRNAWLLTERNYPWQINDLKNLIQGWTLKNWRNTMTYLILDQFNALIKAIDYCKEKKIMVKEDIKAIFFQNGKTIIGPKFV